MSDLEGKLCVLWFIYYIFVLLFFVCGLIGFGLFRTGFTADLHPSTFLFFFSFSAIWTVSYAGHLHLGRWDLPLALWVCTALGISLLFASGSKILEVIQ